MASPPCCRTADWCRFKTGRDRAGQVIDDAMRAFGALVTAAEVTAVLAAGAAKELHVDLPPCFAWLEG
jgi:hypothetical protein